MTYYDVLFSLTVLAPLLCVLIGIAATGRLPYGSAMRTLAAGFNDIDRPAGQDRAR